jgi:hypothetical protein
MEMVFVALSAPFVKRGLGNGNWWLSLNRPRTGERAAQQHPKQKTGSSRGERQAGSASQEFGRRALRCLVQIGHFEELTSPPNNDTAFSVAILFLL